MRWRLSKLNWSYGVGEFLIVVSGVLIALAVDQWYAGRLDRQEEQQLLARLTSDLQRDIEDLNSQSQSLDRKMQSLLRIQSALAAGREALEDPTSFLQDIVGGANYGWNQAEARRTTIDELLATGKLALIRDSEVRETISQYYDMDRGIHQRIDERETEYPSISYQLVPRENEGTVAGDADEIELSLDNLDIETVVSRVFESSLGEHVGAELNFARFVKAMGTRLETAARDLILTLEEHQDNE